MSNEEISKMVDDYENQVKGLKAEAWSICWHSRGGMSYGEAHLISQMEREIISKEVKKNMETTNKTGIPYF